MPLSGIRYATPGELPALALLMARSPLLRRYAVAYESALAGLRAALESADTILVSGEPAVGLAWLSFAPRVLNGAAYLRLLLVEQVAQAQGVGSRLLSGVEAAATARANHLYLLATTDNDNARRWYERRGFRHVGDLPGLVRPDLDEALYHKSLRGYDARLDA
ncbi:MAG: GNAT family N-acetyltransferase [Chloroflexota bacterium]|nr:GNAT family N-acetyltransferase [Chloroflexota bacterium]